MVQSIRLSSSALCSDCYDNLRLDAPESSEVVREIENLQGVSRAQIKGFREQLRTFCRHRKRTLWKAQARWSWTLNAGISRNGAVSRHTES